MTLSNHSEHTKIIYLKKSGRKYYTLLGWDGNDGRSTKKIIEPMYFSGKTKVKFGLPIFKLKDKTKPKRIACEKSGKNGKIRLFAMSSFYG